MSERAVLSESHPLVSSSKKKPIETNPVRDFYNKQGISAEPSNNAQQSPEEQPKETKTTSRMIDFSAVDKLKRRAIVDPHRRMAEGSQKGKEVSELTELIQEIKNLVTQIRPGPTIVHNHYYGKDNSK